MKNTNTNLYLSICLATMLTLFSSVFLPFSAIGFIAGILYAQLIEWFVHGWIQHHPFKIFKPYRDMHTFHHKYPEKPLAVQPVSYFIIGSVFLLAPFFWAHGFYAGYFFTYIFINVIHHDLHSVIEKRILSKWIWGTGYFKLITSHHEAHHTGKKLKYTTYSVTNPYMDMVLTRIRVNKFNNWIAKKLKI